VFLGSVETNERKFLAELLENERLKSRYRKLVEPAGGSFAVATLASTHGWDVKLMDLSDVSIFSAILGCAVNGEDLSVLNLRLDGEPMKFTGSPVHQAAEALFMNLLVRNEVALERKPSAYMAGIVEALALERESHIAKIEEKVAQIAQRLSGARYRNLDLFEHIAECKSDPEVFVVLNPPTYKAGFEKMFDTGGRMEWDEPPYEIFDPFAGPRMIDEEMAEAECLSVCLRIAEPEDMEGVETVYSRHGPGTMHTYYVSNRPEEIVEYLGGKRAAPKGGAALERPPAPIMPRDHVITKRSKIEVRKITAAHAEYFKQLWAHRIQSSGAPANFVVLIDGFVANVFGTDLGPSIPGGIKQANGDHWLRESMLLTYSFSPPHDIYGRLTLLGTRVAMQRAVVMQTAGPTLTLHAHCCTYLVTVMLTRYPEAKGNRGLLELVERRDDPEHGYRLIYRGEIEDKPFEQVLAEWLDKEERWLRNRAKLASSSATG
jgi:hypothetical protein